MFSHIHGNSHSAPMPTSCSVSLLPLPTLTVTDSVTDYTALTSSFTDPSYEHINQLLGTTIIDNENTHPYDDDDDYDDPTCFPPLTPPPFDVNYPNGQPTAELRILTSSECTSLSFDRELPVEGESVLQSNVSLLPTLGDPSTHTGTMLHMLHSYH
jgi:hypothetical protein